MSSLLNELKRRHVFRAATSYAIVSWVLVEVSTAVIPVFEAPDWVLKALILFVVAGFPIVVVLAWAYELTPEGIKRAEEVDAPEPASTRVVDSILVAILVLALGITAVNKLVPDGTISHVTASVGGTSTTAPSIPEAKIAIMPFATLNTDPEVTTLAEGFSEALHNDLLRTTDLHLTGSASNFAVARSKRTRKEIAELLGADYQLEGTVRKNNGNVHVFAQLVELPAGEPVWSYDITRPHNDLESIQTGIVAGIANHFDVTIDESRLASGLASPAYHTWLQLLGLLRSGGDLAQTKNLANNLIEAEPEFAPAHAILGYALSSNPALSDAADFHKHVSRVEDLLNKAIVLSPDAFQVQLWRARSESVLRRWRGRHEDFESINQGFEQALSRFPGNGDLLAAYAEHKFAWGESRPAVELAKRALKRDRLSTMARRVQIEGLIRAGLYDVADDKIQTLAGTDLALRLEARLAIARGELRQALATYNKISDAEDNVPLEAARLWSTLGDVVRANHIIEQQQSSPHSDIWKLALEHRYGEAYQLAREELQPRVPQDALLAGILAVQAGENDVAVEYFSRFFPEWVRDSGPLRGTAAMRYAPWFARALMKTGEEASAHRLLDRHLAGVILVESDLSAAQSDLYLAANFATGSRQDDAARALERAITDSFRVTRGALGDPVDIKQSELFASMREGDSFSQLMNRI